jgi:Spy/CpxP family protein refolding chaperone
LAPRKNRRKAMRRSARAASLAGVFVVLGGMPVKAWPDEKDGPAPHGHGTGFGMMDDDGDNGMGPGMRGGDAGYGMGSGMMGSDAGYGVGPGMMGGDATYGMGPGMMSGYGMGPIWMLDLSDPQRAKVNAIGDQLRKTHWAIMGKILDEQTKLRDLNSQAEPDPKAIGAVYASISRLRQGMVEAHVQATNQARDVLTKEQRETYDAWRRDGRGYRSGYHRGMGNGVAGPH